MHNPLHQSQRPNTRAAANRDVAQRKGSQEEEESLQGKFHQPVQRQSNRIALPDNPEKGINNQSGMGMENVQAHYSSVKPTQLYTRDTDTHAAPGHEQPAQTPLQLPQPLVVQNKFTAEGATDEEIKKWEEETKNNLTADGENVLLDWFNHISGLKKAVPWDIKAAYKNTKFELKKMLYEHTERPLTLWDDDLPVERLAGNYDRDRKKLTEWDIQNRGVLNPATHTELAHVSKKGDWMEDRIDTAHGSAKGEFGQGFYMVTGHDESAAKGIRDEFGAPNKEPRDVLRFRIANTELIKLVNGDVALGAFLVYILQHPSGYPTHPGALDPMTAINRINKMGKVLIFPENKDTEVDVDNDGTKHSYESFRKINGGAVSHSLIIGPQAPKSLAGIRQVCARGYLGDKVINEAPRSAKRLGPKGS